MKLLLDTHILLWWLDDDTRLKPQARDAIALRTNEILISVVSLWEIVVKTRTRKLDADISEIIDRLGVEGFRRLSIERPHLAALATLPAYHRDPFDHLLIAQAICEDATFVSDDRMISKYPVRHF